MRALYPAHLYGKAFPVQRNGCPQIVSRPGIRIISNRRRCMNSVKESAEMKSVPAVGKDGEALLTLEQGVSSLKKLESLQEFDPSLFRTVVRFLKDRNQVADAFQVFQKWKQEMTCREREQFYTLLIKMFCKARMPLPAEILLHEMKYEGYKPRVGLIGTVMLCCIKHRLFENAWKLWGEILALNSIPNVSICVKLIEAYAEMGCLCEMSKMFEEMKSRGFILDDRIYAALISCYGKAHQLVLMKNVYEEMLSNGSTSNVARENAILQYHCYAGSLDGMEKCYRHFKKCRYSLKVKTVRAMALLYIQNQRFYQLEEFIKDVGLARKNAGNLLWNLLLLCSAATFKMRKLQRDFVTMLESGFMPDLMTFNIRTLAFSKMQMYWDLYISILHMRQLNVTPDLVTFGSIVDCYVDGKIVRKLSFTLDQMGMMDTYPETLTDSLIFEAFGKGDFFLFVEESLHYSNQKHYQKQTYSKLLKHYLKKCTRKGQLFWNY